MPKFTALARRWSAEDPRRGERMDVIAAAESFHQKLISGKVGEQAKFDLRVVGREQHMAFFGDEGGADLAPLLSANGNVLQIWVRGREPARRSAGLIERRMQAPGLGIQQHRQRV